MPDRNETYSRKCRFLSNDDFDVVHKTLTTAFSDYVIPFALTESQLRNHMVLTAVDLERSAGCFIDGRLVGTSLNGFGNWQGRLTAYDTCTGVLPEFRRRGISSAMFELMIPHLRSAGVEQFLLEVISTNAGAVRLYDELGFKATRELALLQCDKRPDVVESTSKDVELQDIGTPEWPLLKRFWDVEPSWQNLPEAMERSVSAKRMIGGFYEGKCIGYILFSARSGRIAQMAVSKEHRRKRVGSMLLNAMHAVIDTESSPQVVNADIGAEGMLAFFTNFGYHEMLRQHEMLLEL
jgi:ribosomal protein S18 acetylase RimI-like enzyme